MRMRIYLAAALAVLTVCALGAALASQPAARLTIDLTQETPAEPEDRPPDGVEVEIISREAAPETDEAPRVLIYHSHTCEAFESDFDGQYRQTERWRTKDARYSVVRLGAELADILRSRYGMTVVHDDTNFELPSLGDAYARSLEALENYFARGEQFDFYIDLHRDAYIDGLFRENSVALPGGRAARLMFLVGTGEGSLNGRPFAQKPDWQKNLALAEEMTEYINAAAPGLCRKPSVKTGRYNQHVSPGALLVEVGNNMNSLGEALAAVPILAEAIAEACR